MLPAEWFREAALTAALRCGREEEDGAGACGGILPLRWGSLGGYSTYWL